MTEAPASAPQRIGWSAYAIGLLFWIPLLSGIVSRLTRDRAWFADYGAIACAAEKMLAGAPFYSRNLECPGVPVSGYVYHPALAQLFTWPLSMLGQANMRVAYAALFIACVGFLIWFMIGRRSAAAPRAKRNWFAAFIVGSAVYWGNIAVVIHALIAFCAVVLRKRPSLLVLAIAAAAIVKPLFVSFGAVFVLARWPLGRRVAYGLATLILAIAPTAWFAFYGGALAEQWRELVTYYVYIDRPGEAFLGWVDLFGGDIRTPAAAIGYLVFAALILLAGLVIAEGLALDDDARALFGLSLGVLLIPRLMGPDFWLLGAGLIAMAGALSAVHAAHGRLLERALLAICVVVLIGNMADLADYTTKLATLALALLVVLTAVVVAHERKLTPGALWRRVSSGAASEMSS